MLFKFPWIGYLPKVQPHYMTIKHISGGEAFDITYKIWFNQYLKTGKFRNFKVTNDSDIVEVYEIHPQTGEMRFKTLADKLIAESFKANDQRRYEIQELQYNFYDQNLVPTEEFFKRFPDASNFKKVILGKEKGSSNKNQSNSHNHPKSNLSQIFGSTIPKQLWAIIRGVLILLIAYLLWALFGEILVSYFD